MGNKKWTEAAEKYTRLKEEKEIREEELEKKKEEKERKRWLKSAEGQAAQKTAQEFKNFINSDDGDAATSLLSAVGKYIFIWENSDDGGDSYWAVRFDGRKLEKIHRTYNGQGDTCSASEKELEPLEAVEYAIESGIQPKNFMEFLTKN